jgi:outer membrane putative beta-barrel porin/alpha-amylase
VILACPARYVAQELEPRAYSISPKGANFAVVGFSRSAGDLNFDPSLPIEDAKSVLHGTFLAYGRAMDFFGRSANVAVTLPYIWGDVEGKVDGNPQQARRSGMANPAVRYSVNLYGAPAMDLEQFARFRQNTNLGVSIVVVPPLGQYDPARFVNIGTNRWGVKPEIGISQRFRRWYFDLYLGAWFFSENDSYVGRVRKQDPIASAQIHVSYNFKRRLWAAFDANYYTGGRTSIDGVARADLQRNSRIGGTISIPLTKRQSLKFSGSSGAVTNIGANFISIGASFQYLWGGGL